jgi:hypothetical protein
MKLLRTKCIRNLLTLITGLTFLNLSFFLIEVEILKLDKKSSLIQNFTNSGIEEEKESGESTEGSSKETAKEEYLSLEQRIHHKIVFCSIERSSKVLHNLLTCPGYKKIVSPPPEQVL